MTDPLGGQSAAAGTGQSAGTGTVEPATAAAGGQSAPAATGTTAAPQGQSAPTREEFDRVVAQLAAADKARAAAEAAHAQLRDKDMPALQKAERDLQVATAALAERDATISQLRLEVAFFTDNEREWHNPATALQLLDRTKIQVGADGTVTGMKDALTALATQHAYLLKPEAAAGGAGTPPAPAAPGTAPANGGIAPAAGSKMDAAEMARRYPALQQRLAK